MTPANLARKVLGICFWRLVYLRRPRARVLAKEIVRFRMRVGL